MLWTSEFPKMVQNLCAFGILTWKCASRHCGVQCFDLRASKSGLNPRVFNILAWKGASRPNGVTFFHIPTSKSGRSNEPTFQPNPPTNHRKNAMFRDFPNISPTSIFFLLSSFFDFFFLSSTLLFSAFHLSILSEV